MYWKPASDNACLCCLCPNRCNIKENRKGLCGVRANISGRLYAESYGQISAIALDPIEKKPLKMYMPGKKILSIGSFGCNLHCPFCQNYKISLDFEDLRRDVLACEDRNFTPEMIKNLALESAKGGNVGVAYTYNEPLIGYEFVLDCATMIKNEGLVNVLVTNGYICEEPLLKLLPYIDAMNVDIKGIVKRTYNMVGGTADDVLRSVKLSHTRCHVEVTTLVVPGVNESEVEEIAKWISMIDPEIPYHISRFSPNYMYSHKESTDLETLAYCFGQAKKYLANVFLGNV